MDRKESREEGRLVAVGCWRVSHHVHGLLPLVGRSLGGSQWVGDGGLRSAGGWVGRGER